jgi:hypothetical protein
MNTIKLKPYPFPVTLMVRDVPHIVDVMKITNIGFIVKTDQIIHLRVGHKTTGLIKIPLGAKEYAVNLKVIKTWDQADKKYLIELHFISPDVALIDEINAFVKKIGQT